MAALFRSLVVIFPPASVWTACESAAAPTPAPTRGSTPADDPPASPVDDPTRLPSPSRLPRGGPKRPLLRAGGLRAAFAARAQVRAQGCGAAAALRSGRIVRRAECGYRAPSRAQNKGRLEESRAAPSLFGYLSGRSLARATTCDLSTCTQATRLEETGRSRGAEAPVRTGGVSE